MQQSGGGVVDTGNQQAVDGDNQRAQWPTYMRSTGLLWKVARIQSSLDRKALSLRKNIASLGFRASCALIPHRTSHLRILEFRAARQPGGLAPHRRGGERSKVVQRARLLRPGSQWGWCLAKGRFCRQ
jgi:hypothetical protein